MRIHNVGDNLAILRREEDDVRPHHPNVVGIPPGDPERILTAAVGIAIPELEALSPHLGF